MASHTAFRLARLHPIWRGLVALLVALVVLVPTVAEAATAPRKYAGIVVDAKSGKVLYEHAADAAALSRVRHQGDDALRPVPGTRGRQPHALDQDDVSRHAASAVPTKLGLGAGKTISVEDAIKALVTHLGQRHRPRHRRTHFRQREQVRRSA